MEKKTEFSENGLEKLKDLIVDDCARFTDSIDDLDKNWQSAKTHEDRQKVLYDWADALEAMIDGIQRTRNFILTTAGDVDRFGEVASKSC